MRVTIHVLTHQHAQNLMAQWDRGGWFEDLPLPKSVRRGLSFCFGWVRRNLTTAWCYPATREVFVDGGVFGLEPMTRYIEVRDYDMQHPRELGRYIVEEELKCGWNERLALVIMHEIGHIYWRCGHTFTPGYLMFPSWMGRGWKIGRPRPPRTYR